MPSQPDWRRERPQDSERTPAEDWPDSDGGSPFAGRPYLDGPACGKATSSGGSRPDGSTQSYGNGQSYSGQSYGSQPAGDGRPYGGQWGYQDQPAATQYLGPQADSQYPGQYGSGLPGDTHAGGYGTHAGGYGTSPFGDAPYPGDPAAGPGAPYPGDPAAGPETPYPGDPAAGPDGPGPAGPGSGNGRRAGRRWTRIGLSIAAVALVVAGLGAYGVARMHHASSLAAVQDSARGPCASHGQGSGQGSGAARPCAAGAGTSAASSPAASASASARPRHHRKHHHQVTPTPTPTATPKPHPAPSSSAPAGTSSSSAAAQVLSVINQARAQAGLSAYTLSSGLDTSSRRHTQVMAGGCGLSHQCPGEASLGDRLTAAGVQWTAAGENIGDGGPVPGNTAQITKMAVGLTRSMLEEKAPDDGHRLNILSSSFTHIGIYVFQDSHGTVWMTQDFSN